MPLSRKSALAWIAMAGIGLSVAVQVSRAADEAVTPRLPWKTSRVQGSPLPPEPYRIVPAFPNLKFEKPTGIEEFPAGGRLLVTEIGGRIFSFPKAAAINRADLVVNLQELLPKELASKRVSLFDAAFHPKFSDNHYLFVCYDHPADGGQVRVSRLTLDGASTPRAVPGSEQVVIAWRGDGHKGGCLEFGVDGCLYISTGDGAGPNPPDGRTTGQDVSDLLGSILRIDVDHASGQEAYSVPADNPFVNLPGARPEIWAFGLRNPFKFGIDRQTGNIFAADNGWETWEMIHRIVRGGNCGWPVMEGRARLRSEVKLGPTPIIPPVKDHPHTEANSVIGGPVYRGAKLPGLDGSFVYGDYITGTIWAIRPDKDNSYSCTTLVDTDQRIVAFTEGKNGELFVLDHDFSGQIFELLPSDVKDTSATFPRRLSQTGLFTSLEKLEPAPGVMPYTVRVERWMDGAKAQRWAAIPGDGRIQLASGKDTPAIYPEGTVLVKHLDLPQSAGAITKHETQNTKHKIKHLDLPQTAGAAPIRLETQLLHYERGTWHPYSYLWDEAGKDATLVDSIGASRVLRVVEKSAKDAPIERTWHVNATNECKLCHNAGPKFVLGFTLNQLDHALVGTARTAPPATIQAIQTNQLSRLAAQGVIAVNASIAADDAMRLVDPYDPSQSLDDRARSYLHGNCAMCHHPGGNAIVSFFLRRDLPFDKLNTNKGTGIGTFGLRDAKIIVPGDPYRSVLMYRMSKLGYARMPYIGSRVVDSAGVALIEQWIRSLPSNATDNTTQEAAEATSRANALRVLESQPADQDKPANQGQAADDAAGELLGSTGGSLALALEIHRGLLSETNVQKAVTAGNSAKSDIRGLFETFVPESKRRPTLGATIDPQVILDHSGDRERGKLIFFSDGARCRACHELDDRSKSLGPTLQEIVKKYPRPAEMIQHVLQPSLKVDEPFAAYTIVTDDGRVLSGLIVEQNDREIVFKTIEKQVLRIARPDIAEMRKGDKSLMPDRILSDLTAQEAADLLEYIRSQVGSP